MAEIARPPACKQRRRANAQAPSFQANVAGSSSLLEEAAQLHKKMNPETDVDDTIGTLRMQFQYMFNEQTKRDGLGYFNPGQLQETYNVVAEAQHLPAGVDATQFVDTSYLPKE